MRHVRIVVLVILAGFLASQAEAQRKEVIGYFPSWKWRSQARPMTVEKIPFDKVTLINYAFFSPLPDGTIAGSDTAGDAMFLLGRAGPANPGGRKIAELAHQHSVRMLLSLGGWGASDNFPALAASPLARARFASSCVRFLRDYDFDGIDIDWEFPGFAEHRGTAADKENCTLLLQTLRDSIERAGEQSGRTYLLTAALPAGATLAEGFDMKAVARILDQLNLMTYDYYGPWDSLADHNAPLFASEGSDSSKSIDATLMLYRDVYKVPLAKLNLGLPFYGRAYAGCAGLRMAHAGADTVHFSSQGAFYYDIQPLVGSSEVHRDEKARVPSMTIPAWKVFVTYDDEESVREKARYAVERGVHGMIIWELTGDFMPDESTPLLDELHAVFSGKERN